MPTLPSELRSLFENEVVTARDVAEKAAEAALATLAVKQDRTFDSMTEAQRELRRVLRARARQLGGGEQGEGMTRLIEEIAYEQWHRLLFSRFLADNNLLMHPEWKVAVSLEECEELAPEIGVEDRWEVAARFAVAMLPGIFNFEDPALQVRFAPEYRQRLEQIVSELPKLVFTADDSLGWAYQFWQSKKKDEVNASERKIGGADIGPVTQLFTEDYMVKFLLHNSLGAWWAARHPDSPLLKDFEYLRYREDGTPAAGTFEGWPERAAEVTMMDPCCGSGHFLVAAFEMLTKMRMEEEGLGVAAAGDVVIQDNLFGLEIDLRCTQIAAFNLVLTAWKSGGYHSLPIPNIACSGISTQGEPENWTELVGNDEIIKHIMKRLFQQFFNASHLGSLIDPGQIAQEEKMFITNFEKITLLLKRILDTKVNTDEPSAALFGKNIKGVVWTASILNRKYTLVATNVPYLGRNKQSDVLSEFFDENYPDSKYDQASVFIERILRLLSPSSMMAIVSPQNWRYLISYERMRKSLLKNVRLQVLARLGTNAFRTISGEVVNVMLVFIEKSQPTGKDKIVGIDVSNIADPEKKAHALKVADVTEVSQKKQLDNPRHLISLQELDNFPPLSQYIEALSGLSTGDLNRFVRFFWEVKELGMDWEFLLRSIEETAPYAGRSHIIYWQEEKGELYELAESVKHLNHAAQNWRRGKPSWGKRGVCVSLMSGMPVTLYSGDMYDETCCALVPYDKKLVPALWAFCSSDKFRKELRKINPSLNVKPGYILRVPFDKVSWESTADGNASLPKQHSNDITQWLFNGHPVDSTEPLQVAIARLAGYHWPDQEDDSLKTLEDEDGIICLPPVVGKASAADRLRSFLAQSYGDKWTPKLYRQLLKSPGFAGKELEVWLLDGFFDQHCKLFQNRPFVWHIWDGRKDGFSALVNYHKLDHARLERLIYTYLGDWIRTQKAELEQNVPGAEGRLVAALELKKKLELILEGEPPYDIYVRWKELHEQPIGWNPDLNDGVRLNIRPFVEAGVLRSRFTINWGIDRGTNPDGSRRRNDLHFTRAVKEAARARAR